MGFSHKVIMQGTDFRMIGESTHKLQRRTCRSAIKGMVSQKLPQSIGSDWNK